MALKRIRVWTDPEEEEKGLYSEKLQVTLKEARLQSMQEAEGTPREWPGLNIRDEEDLVISPQLQNLIEMRLLI